MKSILTVFLILLSAPALFAQKKKTTVAVLEFQSAGSLDKVEAVTLTNRFRALLVKTQVFQVVEREKMNEILKAQDFNISDGCNTAECAVQVGQLLGVEAMVAGDVGKIGSTYTIDIRMINVETGGVIQSQSQNHRGEIDGLLDLLQSMANSLVEAVSGQPTVKLNSLTIVARIPPMSVVHVDILVDGNKVGEDSVKIIVANGIHKVMASPNSADLLEIVKEVDVAYDQKVEFKLRFSESYRKRVAEEEARKKAAEALAEKQRREFEKAERERLAKYHYCVGLRFLGLSRADFGGKGGGVVGDIGVAWKGPLTVILGLGYHTLSGQHTAWKAQVVPILLEANYVVLSNFCNPFITLGVGGTSISWKNTDSQSSGRSSIFSISAGGGVTFVVSNKTKFHLALRSNTALKSAITPLYYALSSGLSYQL